jgi:hypothetical protein
VIVVKFHEGGWITLVITGILVMVAAFIKQHYYKIGKEIVKIQRMMNSKIPEIIKLLRVKIINQENYSQKSDSTAVVLVNGYSGIGLFSIFSLINTFHNTYKNFVFLQIGIVDSGSFHQEECLQNLKEKMELELNKYSYLVKQLGFNAESRFVVGTDVAAEVEKVLPEIVQKYPDCTFVGGQLMFDGHYGISKILHNYTIFSIQRRLYKQGITTVIIPISLQKASEIDYN